MARELTYKDVVVATLAQQEALAIGLLLGVSMAQSGNSALERKLDEMRVDVSTALAYARDHWNDEED